MVWAIGLDDFKNRCGEGSYPLLNEIKDVLKDGGTCNPTTTPNAPNTSAPPQTTMKPTIAPPQTTMKPNPTTTPDTSGPQKCRPTDVFADSPGMNEWCDLMCNHHNFCPSTHCICDSAPTVPPTVIPTTTKAPPTTPVTVPTTTEDSTNPQGCRPTDTYASQPGMKEWCVTNCAAGYCPGSHCICGLGNSISGKNKRCLPTDLYASQPGMDHWCDANCNAAVPNCPSTHCSCDLFKSKKCDRLNNKGKCGKRWVQRNCPVTCNGGNK